jgi:hypothetical protein
MGTAAPRHVVFFSDCPYYGGAEAYLVLLARARPGPQWRLSALVPEGEPGAILAAKLSSAGVEVARYRVPPIPSRRQLRAPGSLRDRARDGLSRWRQLDRALREFNGDILHLNLPSVYDARLSLPAYLARRAGYRRIVTTEHLPMVPRARRMLLVKRLLAPAIDAIIVHTEWNRDRLARYHHMPRGRMHVIPNGSPEAPAMSVEARRSLREGVGLDENMVGLAVVARLTARGGGIGERGAGRCAGLEAARRRRGGGRDRAARAGGVPWDRGVGRLPGLSRRRARADPRRRRARAAVASGDPAARPDRGDGLR